MKKFTKIMLFLFLSIFLWIGNGLAIPSLTLKDGSHSVTIIDNQNEDLSLTDGIISYFNNSFNGWAITLSMGSSYPAIGTQFDPEMHLTGSVTSTGSGSLDLIFTDTFTWNGDLTNLTSSIGGNAGSTSISFETYLDNELLANFGPVNGAFSNSQTTSISPMNSGEYELTIQGTITAGSAGQAGSFDARIHTPEPAAMLLFGTGLIGFAALGRKKFLKK